MFKSTSEKNQNVTSKSCFMLYPVLELKKENQAGSNMAERPKIQDRRTRRG